MDKNTRTTKQTKQETTTLPYLSHVCDGNEAAALIAHKTNEICVIYPITPATPMGEYCDQWSAEQKTNIWNNVPEIVQMQSEGGVAGAVHGVLQAGTLTTTFTCSQGLLLMIPNMFRIAGELLPCVFHVASRAVAYQGMVIYCEHSDVMATRSTGFAMLCSATVQEAHDMALLTQVVSLKSRIPFLHFFDGLRTSHEVTKINLIADDTIKALLPDDLLLAHRQRKLTSDQPTVRGQVQDADVYFQTRESINLHYQNLPAQLTEAFAQFEKLTGRAYQVVEYFGDSKAENLIVIMGSGAETVLETVEFLNRANAKVGMIKVRLFRPFPQEEFLQALPATTRALAILDRTKEPGAAGEPLFGEIAATLVAAGRTNIKTSAGRFGIASKEFTPAMVKAIFAELAKPNSKTKFTVGIIDDVTHLSLDYDAAFHLENPAVKRAIFYGLGADGTVSSNKNTIKIVGETTDLFVQGYFVYDAKKSGSKTISHLRFSSAPIHSTYLINQANFIGCHQFRFVETMPLLATAEKGAIFLLNSPYPAAQVWNRLPKSLQVAIVDKQIKFYVIDAYKVAQEAGMGGHINTIMQTCFFYLSTILPFDLAVKKIKRAIEKTYANKGSDILAKNYSAVDNAIAHLHAVSIPAGIFSQFDIGPALGHHAADFVKDVLGKMAAGKGDELPVSVFPPDGTFPTHTTRFEKRNLATNVPVWNPETCIQCGQCNIVCPHAVIRSKRYAASLLSKAPTNFKHAKLLGNDAAPNECFTLQIYLEDCTGCGLCVEVCPALQKATLQKALTMQSRAPLLDAERKNIEFFETLPKELAKVDPKNLRTIRYHDPMFEFCNACAGCGEAAYVKLLTQLFGDHLIIADACGCSIVFGGYLPTTPWTVNAEGRGPAFASSLFEDNAEYGYGFLLANEKQQQQALELLTELAPEINDPDLVARTTTASQNTMAEISAQHDRVAHIKHRLSKSKHPRLPELLSLIDQLAKHSVWIIGGDGWAYDIGYGGLDHVLASGRRAKVLVLDTEVYSNTGGQSSKATPRGAVAKFAAQGKPTAKKDLGSMLMTYGNIYVATIALGSNPMQAIKAIQEAETYDGPAIVIAYCHCIAHGIEMQMGMKQQQLAVKSGYWPLYRYNPDLLTKGQNPFQLDSVKPTIPLREYLENENRFQILKRTNPEQEEYLIKLAEQDIQKRWENYESLLKKG